MLRWKSECVNRVARLKMLNSLTVLRHVINAEKRKENATARIRMKITKREEKREQKGDDYAKNADTK